MRGSPVPWRRLSQCAASSSTSRLARADIASACQPVTAHWLRIFPPGDTGAIYVGQSFPACGDGSAQLLTVTPVRSGNGKQGVTP